MQPAPVGWVIRLRRSRGVLLLVFRTTAVGQMGD